MNNEKEIAKTETEEVLPLVARETGLITADTIRQVEAQVEGLNKIKTISLKLTNKSDWKMFSDKPCLNNSGSMKIANLWGVSFHSPIITSETRNDDRGEYIIFTCSGVAEFRGRTVEDIGTSTTRDKLLGTVAGELKPLSEVDLPSIKKESVTNWQSRILKKILGLSFEKEDLEKAGIHLTGGVTYANGGAGGGLISDAQGKRLFAILSKSDKKPEDLKKYLQDNYKIEHTKDIEKKNYESICNWVDKKEIEM